MMEDIEGTVHLDCSGGSGDIHISDVEDLTISDYKADGNNDLNIENCGSYVPNDVPVRGILPC